MKTYLTLALCALLCACQTNTKSELTNLFDGNFPVDTKLEVSSKVPIDFIDPSDVFLSDSMMVVLLRHETNMLHVYDRENYELLGSFLTKGRAANEVSMFGKINQLDVKGNQMKIFMYSYPNKAGWIDVNESLRNHGTVFSQKLEVPKVENCMVSASGQSLGGNKVLVKVRPIKEDRVLDDYTNLMVGYDVDQQKELFRMEQITLDPARVKDSRISMGNSVVSEDGKHMVNTFSLFDAVYFYDFDKQERKELYMSEGAQANMYEMPGSYKYYKNCMAAGDCAFLQKNPTDHQKEAGVKSVFEVFDWDGEAKARFEIKEQVQYFDVDETNEQIYAIVYNEDSEMSEILIYNYDL